MFELSAEIRQTLGKGNSRRIRKLHDLLPAVIYGANQPPIHIQISQNSMQKALKNPDLGSSILTLKIKEALNPLNKLDEIKDEFKVVLKVLQRHPYMQKILHADFMCINVHEKLTISVPLHFINAETAPGVKLQNGIISHHLNEVEIRCLPADLPKYLEVDLSKLKLDQVIHLSELQLPANVELVALSHQDDQLVVSIHKHIIVEESQDNTVVSAAEVPVVGKTTAPNTPEEAKKK